MMSKHRWSTAKHIKINPKCVFCDVFTEPTIIFHLEEKRIMGWKCPYCGFSLIHPREIPKVMGFLKDDMRLNTIRRDHDPRK
jgi:hypothetical protein